MKTLITKSLPLIGLFSWSVSSAQNSQVYHDWTALDESENHIDVFYRVVQCGEQDPTTLYLHVFNENGEPKSVSFEINASDSDGSTQSYSVNTLSMEAGEMISAD